MGYALAGSHPVHFSGSDGLQRTQTVAVGYPAVKEVGDGRKPDMGVGQHIHCGHFCRLQRKGTGMIHENKGTYHASFAERQDAAHFKRFADGGAARVDD
nr:hypothetical protein [Proteiniphilum acetatigenes]